MTATELERRRRSLVAQVTLQRLELHRLAAASRAPEAASIAIKAIRFARSAARWWEIGRLAWRMAAAFRAR